MMRVELTAGPCQILSLRSMSYLKFLSVYSGENQYYNCLYLEQGMIIFMFTTYLASFHQIRLSRTED